MNPTQLRETTLSKQSRKLVQLQFSKKNIDHKIMNMLLKKKNYTERKSWLEKKGNLAYFE